MPKLGVKKRLVKKEVYYPYRGYANTIRVIKLLGKSNYCSTKEIAEKIGGKTPHPHNRTLHLLEKLESLEYVNKFRLLLNKNHTCTYCKKSTRYLEREDNLVEELEFLAENKKNNQGLIANDEHVLGRLIYPTCFGCGQTAKDYDHLDDEYKVTNYRYWSLSYNGLFANYHLLKGEKKYDFVKLNDGDKIFKMMKMLLQNQKKELVERLNYSLKQIYLIKPTVLNHIEEWYNDMVVKVSQMNISKTQNLEFSEYKKGIRWMTIQRKLS